MLADAHGCLTTQVGRCPEPVSKQLPTVFRILVRTRCLKPFTHHLPPAHAAPTPLRLAEA